MNFLVHITAYQTARHFTPISTSLDEMFACHRLQRKGLHAPNGGRFAAITIIWHCGPTHQNHFSHILQDLCSHNRDNTLVQPKVSWNAKNKNTGCRWPHTPDSLSKDKRTKVSRLKRSGMASGARFGDLVENLAGQVVLTRSNNAEQLVTQLKTNRLHLVAAETICRDTRNGRARRVPACKLVSIPVSNSTHEIGLQNYEEENCGQLGS